MNGVTAKVGSVCVVVLALALGGCAPSLSGSAYSRYEAGQAQEVRLGTVEHVRRVEIEGTKSGIGTAAGGVAGGIAGSAVGGGRGRALAALGGALLGGLAGSAIEESNTRRPGLEITVRLDGGRTVAVVQEADEAFFPGERVRLLTAYDGRARVTH